VSESSDWDDVSGGRTVRGVIAGKAYVRPERNKNKVKPDPVVTNPAPPEDVAKWEAYYAPGPGAPGWPDYVTGGGPGFQQAYKEARGKFYWLGGGNAALTAAAEHGSFEPKDLIAMMVRAGDLEPEDAADLRRNLQ
jgi:hypothetical protein